ncbi:hypothetical protein K440DRAFT_652229 [Wilcoxina mikolae CBS 423.85]|nr:hypothetical protein K440DRAFT_652229 [Wilcoxina mikolae CBS 423.85]
MSPSPTLKDWEIQTWPVDANGTLGTVARKYDAENVWLENGRLHLRQMGYDMDSDEPVSVAEVHSRRNDIFHGSFRMRYEATQEPGAKGGSVAGFFFYYTSRGQHRFDWTNASVKFYQNSLLKRQILKNIPKHVCLSLTFFVAVFISNNGSPGKIMFNLWANNGSWSGPPSTKDVKVEIHYVDLYFNTTDSNDGKDDEFNKACGAARGQSGAVCLIDDTDDNIDRDCQKGWR